MLLLLSIPIESSSYSYLIFGILIKYFRNSFWKKKWMLAQEIFVIIFTWLYLIEIESMVTLICVDCF